MCSKKLINSAINSVLPIKDKYELLYTFKSVNNPYLFYIGKNNVVIINFSDSSFNEKLKYLQEFCDKKLYVINISMNNKTNYNNGFEYYVSNDFNEYIKVLIKENIACNKK